MLSDSEKRQKYDQFGPLYHPSNLGLIEPIGLMLPQRDLWRVIQIQRLRQDLGLN